MKETTVQFSHNRYQLRNYINRKAVGAVLVVIVVLYILSLIPTQVAYANQAGLVQQVYKTIEIKAGDSLWSIAKEYYSGEYESLTEYIKMIKECNSLKDESITAGCYLIIPYYQE